MNNGAMVDYFDYKGVRYYRGSVFECKNFWENYTNIRPTVKVKFWEHNRRNGICFLSFESNHGQWMYDINVFLDNIISVVEPVTKEVASLENAKYKSDKSYYHWQEGGEDFYRKKPNDLIYGWCWYVLLMAIATIFNDRIGLWLLISFVFFRWRKKKIMEG